MRLSAIQRLAIASFILCALVVLYLKSSTYLLGSVTGLPTSFSTGHATKPQSISASRNSTASPALLAFWKEWAGHIEAAKPEARPVQLDYSAPNVPAPDDPLARRQKPTSYTRLLESDVGLLKAAHTKFRRTLDDDDRIQAAKHLYNGTGVVSVAGGEYFGPIIVGIKMLRQTGSTLPVEVFLADWNEYEPEVCEIVLVNLNARCVVIEDYLRPKPARSQWEQDDSSFVDEDMYAYRAFDISHFQLKALAILLSSFEHILYLDSDSIPLVKPETDLFAAEPYTKYGLVGWPDFWKGTEEPRFYEIAGFARDEFPSDLHASSSETGQLLVDKSRHLQTLLLATYYNIWGPDHYYPVLSQGAMGQGDKETFVTAAVVLGKPYYRVKTKVKSVGRMVVDDFKGSAMIQSHPDDDFLAYRNQSLRDKRQVKQPLGGSEYGVRPAFIHANTPKMNAGHLVDEGDLSADGGRRLRLWGPAPEQESLFGEDLERRVWEVLVDVGCALEHVLNDWKNRKKMCKRLQEHWHDVFEKMPDV